MNEENGGLSKQLSILNVWSLAFGCIIGFGCFVLPGNSFLKQAGPLGTAIAIYIGAIVMIVIAFNYSYMINKYPVAGGEFTYTNKVFGEKHGFVCAWFLGLSYGTLVPMNATALALIGRNILNDFFQFGFHYVSAGFDIYFGELVLAIVAIVIFGILAIRGVKMSGAFQVLLTIMLITGVMVILIAAICNANVTMETVKPAFNPNNSGLSGILAVMAVAPFLFVGFDTVPQSAEEFKFSTKKTKMIMIVSLLFGAAIYIIVNTVTAAVFPADYSSWVEYVDDIGNLQGLKSLPTFNAAYQLLGNAGLFFIGIAVLGATLSGIVGFYMATSRLLYSMAKERVIPEWFGQLHHKYNTPVWAIIFIMLFSLIAPFFGRTVLGWLVDMSSLGAAIGYGYTSAAVVKYARDEKNTLHFITGIIGTLLSICFAILLLIPIPGLNCSLGRESYICLAIWLALGVAFFVIAKRRETK